MTWLTYPLFLSSSFLSIYFHLFITLILSAFCYYKIISFFFSSLFFFVSMFNIKYYLQLFFKKN